MRSIVSKISSMIYHLNRFTTRHNLLRSHHFIIFRYLPLSWGFMKCYVVGSSRAHNLLIMIILIICSSPFFKDHLFEIDWSSCFMHVKDLSYRDIQKEHFHLLIASYLPLMLDKLTYIAIYCGEFIFVHHGIFINQIPHIKIIRWKLYGRWP